MRRHPIQRTADPRQRVQLSASELDLLAADVAALQRAKPIGDHLRSRVIGGQHIIVDDTVPPFWAIITSSADTAYAWSEVIDDGEGVLGVLSGGRTGTTTNAPAREVSGSTTVPDNTIVLLHLDAYRTGYLFAVTETPSFIQITSTTAVDGRYPGYRYDYDVVTQVWSQVDAIWAISPNSKPIITGVYYDATKVGALTATEDTLSANTNNYALLDETVLLELDATAAWDLTGITAPDPALARILYITNNSVYTITLKHESASSTAANRITSHTAADYALTASSFIKLTYSTGTSRWVTSVPSSVPSALPVYMIDDIEVSPLTTKGDIWVYSTVNTRLPVGTNNYVLTADSAQATGVKWAAASGGTTSPLTTKGDIWSFSTVDARLPVGTNGYYLVADSAETTGLKWVVGGSGPITYNDSVNYTQTETTLSSNQNNYALASTVNNWVINATSSFDLTGIAAPSPEAPRWLIVTNTGTATITLPNESGSSTDVNRFLTSTGGPVTVGPEDSVFLLYDTTENRWRTVGGSAVTNVYNNYTATAAPTVNDDSGDGYAVGSVWIDVTNDLAYVLTDATATAAVWKPLSNPLDKVNASAAPTVNDDSGDGYSVGSIWIDTTADAAYVLVDATVGAAVWLQLASAGTSDHGALTGLADDDHAQYIFNTPTSTARNTITPSAADKVPLTIDGYASQTASLQEWIGNTYTSLVTADGNFSNDESGDSEQFGDGAIASASGAAAFGYNAQASGGPSAAFAKNSFAEGNNTVAIGPGCHAQAETGGNPAIAIAIGVDVDVDGFNSIALGRDTESTASAQFVAGSGTQPITDIYFGSGVTHASPATATLHGTGGSGTDVAGGDLQLAGGRGTGSGASGAVIVQTAPAGSTGTSANALADAAKFDASTTAGNTRLLLYDVDNGTLERVTVGAADSGGVGYKCLRIPN